MLFKASLIIAFLSFVASKHVEDTEEDFEFDRIKVNQKYTQSPTGCACWFDLEGAVVEPDSCACCKPGGRQCGYPSHHFCHRIDKKDRRRGCQGSYFFIFPSKHLLLKKFFEKTGIKEAPFTLSEVGHPCHFDPSRKDCAWCTHGNEIPSFNILKLLLI